MTGLWAIMKKEFDRFFKDKRTVFTSLFLPGIIIYAVYSFIGTGLGGMFEPDAYVPPTAYVVDMPASLSDFISGAGFEVHNITPNDIPRLKEQIAERDSSAIIAVFPADFDARVAAFEPNSPVTAPNIEIYFNSVDPNSLDAFRHMHGILTHYHNTIANVFTINADLYATMDLAGEEAVAAMVISSILPLIMMMMLVSGGASFAPESIAGEKERGTIATMLVTPLKRSHLALGKIFSLASLSFLYGLTTSIAVILALPNMVGGEVRLDIYGVNEYVMLGIVVLSTMLFLMAIASILSAFAKSIREATTYIMPLTIIAMVVSFAGMLLGIEDSAVHFLIPLYSTAQSLSGIFAMDYELSHILIGVISNVVYACIGGFVLTKMFNSERVMFTK